MRRQHGIVRVDLFRHDKTGIEIPIALDKGRCEFRAEHGENVFRVKELEQLRKDLDAYCDTINCLEWVPLIEVETLQWSPEEPDEAQPDYFIGEKTEIQFQFSRYMVAWAGGKWVSSVWSPDLDYEIRQLGHEPSDVERQGIVEKVRRNTCRDFRYFSGAGPSLPSLPLARTPESTWGRDTHTFLHYSEQTWLGLEKLRQGFRVLQQRLNEILASVEGVAKIAKGAGVPLLTAKT